MGINIIETIERREAEKQIESKFKKWISEETSKEFKAIIKLLKELILLIEKKQN